jgi:hypothetical protein
MFFLIRSFIGGYSSVGRAPALHAGSQRFESAYLHWATVDGVQRKREELSARPKIEK